MSETQHPEWSTRQYWFGAPVPPWRRLASEWINLADAARYRCRRLYHGVYEMWQARHGVAPDSEFPAQPALNAAIKKARQTPARSVLESPGLPNDFSLKHGLDRLTHGSAAGTLPIIGSFPFIAAPLLLGSNAGSVAGAAAAAVQPGGGGLRPQDYGPPEQPRPRPTPVPAPAPPPGSVPYVPPARNTPGDPVKPLPKPGTGDPGTPLGPGLLAVPTAPPASYPVDSNGVPVNPDPNADNATLTAYANASVAYVMQRYTDPQVVNLIDQLEQSSQQNPTVNPLLIGYLAQGLDTRKTQWGAVPPQPLPTSWPPGAAPSGGGGNSGGLTPQAPPSAPPGDGSGGGGAAPIDPGAGAIPDDPGGMPQPPGVPPTVGILPVAPPGPPSRAAGPVPIGDSPFVQRLKYLATGAEARQFSGGVLADYWREDAGPFNDNDNNNPGFNLPPGSFSKAAAVELVRKFRTSTANPDARGQHAAFLRCYYHALYMPFLYQLVQQKLAPAAQPGQSPWTDSDATLFNPDALDATFPCSASSEPNAPYYDGSGGWLGATQDTTYCSPREVLARIFCSSGQTPATIGGEWPNVADGAEGINFSAAMHREALQRSRHVYGGTQQQEHRSILVCQQLWASQLPQFSDDNDLRQAQASTPITVSPSVMHGYETFFLPLDGLAGDGKSEAYGANGNLPFPLDYWTGNRPGLNTSTSMLTALGLSVSDTGHNVGWHEAGILPSNVIALLATPVAAPADPGLNEVWSSYMGEYANIGTTGLSTFSVPSGGTKKRWVDVGSDAFLAQLRAQLPADADTHELLMYPFELMRVQQAQAAYTRARQVCLWEVVNGFARSFTLQSLGAAFSQLAAFAGVAVDVVRNALKTLGPVAEYAQLSPYLLPLPTANQVYTQFSTNTVSDVVGALLTTGTLFTTDSATLASTYQSRFGDMNAPAYNALELPRLVDSIVLGGLIGLELSGPTAQYPFNLIAARYTPGAFVREDDFVYFHLGFFNDPNLVISTWVQGGYALTNPQPRPRWFYTIEAQKIASYKWGYTSANRTGAPIAARAQTANIIFDTLYEKCVIGFLKGARFPRTRDGVRLGYQQPAATPPNVNTGPGELSYTPSIGEVVEQTADPAGGYTNGSVFASTGRGSVLPGFINRVDFKIPRVNPVGGIVVNSLNEYNWQPSTTVNPLALYRLATPNASAVTVNHAYLLQPGFLTKSERRSTFDSIMRANARTGGDKVFETPVDLSNITRYLYEAGAWEDIWEYVGSSLRTGNEDTRPVLMMQGYRGFSGIFKAPPDGNPAPPPGPGPPVVPPPVVPGPGEPIIPPVAPPVNPTPPVTPPVNPTPPVAPVQPVVPPPAPIRPPSGPDGDEDSKNRGINALPGPKYNGPPGDPPDLSNGSVAGLQSAISTLDYASRVRAAAQVAEAQLKAISNFDPQTGRPSDGTPQTIRDHRLLHFDGRVSDPIDTANPLVASALLRKRTQDEAQLAVEHTNPKYARPAPNPLSTLLASAAFEREMRSSAVSVLSAFRPAYVESQMRDAPQSRDVFVGFQRFDPVAERLRQATGAAGSFAPPITVHTAFIPTKFQTNPVLAALSDFRHGLATGEARPTDSTGTPVAQSAGATLVPSDLLPSPGEVTPLLRN